MVIAITFLLIVVTALTLAGLRIFRPTFTYAWPIAVVGSFFAWISTFLWQINSPATLSLSNPGGRKVIEYSLSLAANGLNFPYALGISTLLLAVILVSAMKAREANPLGWVSVFFLAVIGLWAILSENPLTLIIAWSALDIAGLISSLNAIDDPELSVRSILAFSSRVVGTGVILWAGVLGFSTGGFSNIQPTMPAIGFLVILGIIIRLGAVLFNIPYSKDPAIRNEYELFYKLLSITSTLVLLHQINLPNEMDLTRILLLLIIGLIGYFSVINSIRKRTDPISRFNWVTGLSVLAISSTVLGNPAGSVAWGSAILFSGGLLFLNKSRNRILTVFLLVSVYILSSLPFSLTASGWVVNSTGTLASQLFLVPLLSLIGAGYIRSIAKDEKENLDNYPRWIKIFYPTGLIILSLTGFTLGFFGWDGAGKWNTWLFSVIASGFSVILTLVFLRLPAIIKSDTVKNPESPPWIKAIRTTFVEIFYISRRLLDILTNVFEGDGGIIWTILFLVVFISLLGYYAF